MSGRELRKSSKLVRQGGKEFEICKVRRRRFRNLLVKEEKKSLDEV